jgi:hypothetical protein
MYLYVPAGFPFQPFRDHIRFRTCEHPVSEVAQTHRRYVLRQNVHSRRTGKHNGDFSVLVRIAPNRMQNKFVYIPYNFLARFHHSISYPKQNAARYISVPYGIASARA